MTDKIKIFYGFPFSFHKKKIGKYEKYNTFDYLRFLCIHNRSRVNDKGSIEIFRC